MIFENGEQIPVGSHGQHNYVFADGEPVPDNDISPFLFESGTGIGGGGGVIDDFESGGLDAYDESNVPELFGVTSSPTFEGDHALRVDLDYSLTEGYEFIRSTWGLPYYPKKGDKFSFWYRTDGADGDKCMAGWNWNGTERYAIWINMSTGSAHEEKVSLGRVEPGRRPINIVDPGQNSFNASPGEWYEIEVDWGDDDVFTLTVYDDDGNVVQSPHSGTDNSPLDPESNFEWRHQVASTYGDRADNVYFDLAKKKE